MRRIVPSMVLAFAVTASVVALVSAQAPANPAAQPTVTFATDIQPILEKNCLSCHGDAMQMSKFDLRSREAAMSGGAHGMVIVPGKLDAKAHSSDPHSGEPWIMWGGTPYEHLMVPIK